MVQLANEKRKQLENLLSQLTCDKDFKCVKNNFDTICNAEYDKNKQSLICFEDKSVYCEFRQPDNGQEICGCVLRMFAYNSIL